MTQPINSSYSCMLDNKWHSYMLQPLLFVPHLTVALDQINFNTLERRLRRRSQVYGLPLLRGGHNKNRVPTTRWTSNSLIPKIKMIFLKYRIILKIVSLNEGSIINSVVFRLTRKNVFPGASLKFVRHIIDLKKTLVRLFRG